MPLHNTTRVPVDDQYAALIGKAVYVFAYYEWTIIWIIELLENGFVSEYCRGNPMMSGAVQKRFLKVINDPAISFAKVSKEELIDCNNIFKNNIVKRNALIHAHPCTDSDGAQILTYQTNPSKPLPDMMWPAARVKEIISIFDEAACSAGVLLTNSEVDNIHIIMSPGENPGYDPNIEGGRLASQVFNNSEAVGKGF